MLRVRYSQGISPGDFSLVLSYFEDHVVVLLCATNRGTEVTGSRSAEQLATVCVPLSRELLI